MLINYAVKKLLLFLFLVPMNAAAQRTELFLLAGQSNAVGQGNAEASVKCPARTAWEYKMKSDSIVELIDPVGEEAAPFQAAHTGSIAPAFASAYFKLTSKQVIIIAAARGGSACSGKAELDGMGTWSTDGKLLLFDAAIQKIKRAEAFTKHKLAGIIWLQGERDANAINERKMTDGEFEAAMRGLIERFRNSLNENVPFYIVLTGYYRNHSTLGFDAVRAVQQKLGQSMEQVFVVYGDTDKFDKMGWMKDDIHYSQVGLNAIGEMAATEIAGRPKK